MPTEPDSHNTFVGLLGLFPAALCVLAFLIGLTSLIVRNKRLNSACGLLLAAIAALGVGITSWRLFQAYIVWEDYRGVEPGAFFAETATALFATGAVLPSVAVGLVLTAIATLLTRNPTETTGQRGSQAEQNGAGNGGSAPARTHPSEPTAPGL